ncbi:MAG TPA: universal stress protein [Pyrinomonadaceae bacterium]|nr:universal stress protein [Pyrinomonadaceae bacterium]
MKILVATDGSKFSEGAVREVARRPWPKGSEARVIYVVEPTQPPPPEMWAGAYEDYFAELSEWQRSQAREALEAAKKILDAREDKTLKVTVEMLTGQPKRRITEEAEDWGADLVVVGSHGYGYLDRLILGSVSQSVLSHAKCSVEIVRRRDSEA